MVLCSESVFWAGPGVVASHEKVIAAHLLKKKIFRSVHHASRLRWMSRVEPQLGEMLGSGSESVGGLPGRLEPDFEVLQSACLAHQTRLGDRCFVFGSGCVQV